MNKWIIVGVVLLVVASGVAYFVTRNGGVPQNGNGTTETAPNTVVIDNFAFSPATLTVDKGTTVVWVNNEFIPHDVASDQFTSEKLSRGEKFEYTYNESGTFAYICGIHPAMKGTIIVR